MNMARLYFKNGQSCWSWHYLKDGRVSVSKDFYDAAGYYRADASYAEIMSKENLQRSLDMAKQLLSRVVTF